jgi:ABC-type dipeptide/oligopeptide/nickel transport system permease subunit
MSVKPSTESVTSRPIDQFMLFMVVENTIGMMIYWANQHTALVAGVWWWIFFPVALVVMTFIGLFLLAVSMNEYIDPRSRLGRVGA